MKEIEKKELPGISGGQVTSHDILPTPYVPVPGYPQSPGGPIDPVDPLGDRISKNQVQS
jgi:hypothetical protein